MISVKIRLAAVAGVALFLSAPQNAESQDSNERRGQAYEVEGKPTEQGDSSLPEDFQLEIRKADPDGGGSGSTPSCNL